MYIANTDDTKLPLSCLYVTFGQRHGENAVKMTCFIAATDVHERTTTSGRQAISIISILLFAEGEGERFKMYSLRFCLYVPIYPYVRLSQA